MPKSKSPNFSQLVCGAPAVQVAFAAYRPTRFWWNLILLLHGKPTNPSLSPLERTRRVADGFRFYAWLYRLLGIIFLMLALIFAVLNVMKHSSVSSYWAAASLLAGAYLWCVSGLGYAGAKTYAFGLTQGKSSLIAFMVMIVAFLSMFLAGISVVAHHSERLATLPNLISVGALFIFGVGSYMIEIIYLATEEQSYGSE